MFRSISRCRLVQIEHFYRLCSRRFGVISIVIGRIINRTFLPRVESIVATETSIVSIAIPIVRVIFVRIVNAVPIKVVLPESVIEIRTIFVIPLVIVKTIRARRVISVLVEYSNRFLQKFLVHSTSLEIRRRRCDYRA